MLKRTVFCEEWEGTPNTSECRRPLQSWKCLNCGSVLNGICVLGGVASGFIGQLFVTGGVFGAIARTMKIANTGVAYSSAAANAGIEAIKSSPRYTAFIQQIRATPYAQAMVNVSKKNKITPFKTISQANLHGIKMKIIDTAKKIGRSTPVISAFNVLIRLSKTPIGEGAKGLLNAQEKVFMSGLNLTAGSTTGNSSIGMLMNLIPEGLLSAAGNVKHAGKTGGVASTVGSSASRAGLSVAGGRTSSGLVSTNTILSVKNDGEDTGQITEQQREILVEALNVTVGELGVDGINAATTGNYTYGQKLRIFRKLMQDRAFSKHQSQTILNTILAEDGDKHDVEWNFPNLRPKTSWSDLWQAHLIDSYHWSSIPEFDPNEENRIPIRN